MKPIYISHRHEVIINTYLETIFSSIKELVDDKSKYNEFKDIANIIIEYHNNYSAGQHTGNFYDFLLIIPVNFSTMVSGFLCGLEDRENASIIKIHKTLLYEFGLRVINEIQELKPIDD